MHVTQSKTQVQKDMFGYHVTTEYGHVYVPAESLRKLVSKLIAHLSPDELISITEDIADAQESAGRG